MLVHHSPCMDKRINEPSRRLSVEAADTKESHARGKRMRERWDSRRGLIRCRHPTGRRSPCQWSIPKGNGLTILPLNLLNGLQGHVAHHPRLSRVRPSQYDTELDFFRRKSPGTSTCKRLGTRGDQLIPINHRVVLSARKLRSRGYHHPMLAKLFPLPIHQSDYQPSRLRGYRE